MNIIGGSEMDGRGIAYSFWRCSVAQAARDAQVNDGDYEMGRALLAQVESVSDADLPRNSEWLAMVIPNADSGVLNAAVEGETGLCYYWLRPYGRWGED